MERDRSVWVLRKPRYSCRRTTSPVSVVSSGIRRCISTPLNQISYFGFDIRDFSRRVIRFLRLSAPRPELGRGCGPARRHYPQVTAVEKVRYFGYYPAPRIIPCVSAPQADKACLLCTGRLGDREVVGAGPVFNVEGIA